MPGIKRSSSGNHRKRRRKSFRRRSAAKLAKDDGIKARVAEIIGLAQTYVTYTIIDGTREYEAVRVAAMAEKQFRQPMVPSSANSV